MSQKQKTSISEWTGDGTVDPRESSTPQSPFSFTDATHEQNDNWQWSESVLEYVAEKTEGFTVNICPGLEPIGDLTFDIKSLTDVSESENASFDVIPTTDVPEEITSRLQDDYDPDLVYGRILNTESNRAKYGGYAAYGDMFDLPLEDNSVRTIITDPPWLSMDKEQRERLTSELCRVVEATGQIILNATWFASHESLQRYDARYRQQRDYWGGPSFIETLRHYPTTPETLAELFAAHNYTYKPRYPVDSPFQSLPFDPREIDPEADTDPRLVDAGETRFVCGICGCSELSQCRDAGLSTGESEIPTDLYECRDCRFRWYADQIRELASEISAAMERQDCDSLHELEAMEYTPPEVKQQLDRNRLGQLPDLNRNLPWIPTSTANTTKSASLTPTKS